MIDESTRLALCDDVAHQSLGDDHDTVVISLKSGMLYTCNDTTEQFVKALDGRRTLGEVIDLLEGEYDVPRDTLAADLSAMAQQLLDEKLIVVVEEDA